MANFSEVLNSMVGHGRSASDDVELDLDTKEKAIAKIDEAIEMINKEGLDGTSFVLNHLSGQKAIEEASMDKEMSGDDKDRKKAMIIMKIKKKNGMRE